MTYKGPQHILKSAKIEDTQILNPNTLQKKIQHAEHSVLEAPLQTPSPEQELKSMEQAAYRQGVLEGRSQGYQTGYEEGLEQGLQKGSALAHEEFKDTISMLNIIAMAFLVRKEELFEQLKPDIVKLCLVICKKLLQRELSQPEALQELIEKLLAQVKAVTKDTPVDVMISSDDYENIKAKLHDFNLNLETLPKIHFCSDPLIEKGNCRLETSVGMINFNLQRLLEDLETKILET